jgi:signal transduction histidine kinase
MRSIRSRLILWLVGGTMLLAVAAGIGLYGYMEEVLEHSLDSALSARASAIAEAVRMEDDGNPHLQADAAAIAAGTHHESPFYFQIWRSDGTTLARVPPPGSGTAPVPVPAANRRRFADVRLPDGSQARAATLSFAAAPDEDEFDTRHAGRARPTEDLRLVVVHDRRSIDGPLTVLLTGLSVTAAVVAGGILLVVTWGVRRGLAPVGEISALAERIGPDSLHVRFPGPEALPSELLPIGRKLNELLDRVEAGFDRERRFSAAVAHELRTPVAELRTACEVALRWPDDRSAMTAAVTEANAIAAEMGRTVQTLLALGRAQAGMEPAPLSDVKLSDSIGPEWAKLQITAVGRGITVERTGDDPGLEVRSDPGALTIIFRNLLENAAEYTPPGGKIRINLRRAGDTAAIEIGNNCDGVGPGDLPRFFEPFWRKSDARTGGTHAGLGLSLVEAYCRTIGATITVASPSGDWIEFAVTVPANPPPNHELRPAAESACRERETSLPLSQNASASDRSRP